MIPGPNPYQMRAALLGMVARVAGGLLVALAIFWGAQCYPG